MRWMKKCRTPPHIKYTHTHSMWCINLKFLLSCPKAANIFFVFFPFNLSASHTKSDRIGLFSKKEKRNEKKGKEKKRRKKKWLRNFSFFLLSFQCQWITLWIKLYSQIDSIVCITSNANESAFAKRKVLIFGRFRMFLITDSRKYQRWQISSW